VRETVCASAATSGQASDAPVSTSGGRAEDETARIARSRSSGKHGLVVVYEAVVEGEEDGGVGSAFPAASASKVTRSPVRIPPLRERPQVRLEELRA